jgi:cell wall-associated NlpC family hydrolase
VRSAKPDATPSSAPPAETSLLLPALIAALAVILLFAATAFTRAAVAAPGGYSPREEVPAPVEPPVGETPTPGLPAPSPVPVAPAGATATLAGERAIAPAAAPAAVKAVIAAANRIRATPYVWGGGHGRWWDRGYDCSGSVSYALHGGGLLEAPLVSGSFATFGEPGAGRWITIYANRQHVYAVIAGLRWDTGGDPAGVTGPRWHAEPPYPKGFAVRHPIGL